MPDSLARSGRPRAIPALRDNAPPRHIFGEAGLRDRTDGIPFVKHGIPGSDYGRADVGSAPKEPRHRHMIFAVFDHRQEGSLMQATHQDQWSFTHRLTQDGSFESVCPVCFETVGRQEQEEDLLGVEHFHVCDPNSLGKIAYFWNPAQD
jgi:hypothetical protein